MRFQSDAAEVRDQVQRILQRREFSYEKSPIRRFIDWVMRKLGDLVPDWNVSLPGAPAGGVGIGSILVAVILIGAAIALVVFAILRLRRRKPKEKSEKADSDLDLSIRATSPTDDWLDQAFDLEAAGDWKRSILIRYRRLVGELTERKLLENTPGSTPEELRADLGSSMPEAVELFAEANKLFQDPWYGDVPTGASEVARFEGISSAILEPTGETERR